MNSQSLASIARYARRASKRADEAEDLLQTVLLAAVEAGRVDLACADNLRWIKGAVRKRAAYEARSAVRRRRREVACVPDPCLDQSETALPQAFVASLPRQLRATALLALTGHTRAEIAWLLGVSDAALRQRIATIKRRWRAVDGSGFDEFPGLKGTLPFGRMRRSLRKPVQIANAKLGTHDPDGHLFIVRSQNTVSR